MSDRVYFIDPGAYKGKATCGAVVLDAVPLVFDASPGEIVRAWSFDGTDLAAVGRVVREAKNEGARIVIERQFPGRNKGNPLDIEKVIETRVKFETLAAICGVPCELVYPATWQTILSLIPLTPEVGKISKRTKRLIPDTKKRAAALVRLIYPGVKLGPHERDAAAMGRWYQVRKRGKEGAS